MEILAGSVWPRLLDPPVLWGAVVLVVAGIAIIAPHWSRTRRSGEVTRLTHRMLERGYTADEIERVLRAGLPDHAAEASDQQKPFIRPQAASRPPSPE
jgi:hypothetical protein